MQPNNIIIIRLEISGGGGCLPYRFAARQKSTTIHLHLSKWLLSTIGRQTQHLVFLWVRRITIEDLTCIC